MAGRVAAGLLAFAAASVLVAGVSPGYDAWLWLHWGRELAHLSLDTDPGSTGVAWKPLPALLAAPLSLFGGAAPDLWVTLVRFCALCSLALAYAIGNRLAGRVAGVVAVIAILLLPDYWNVVARADAEPILVALALGAVELHLRGRRRLALGAITAAALIRPELWPFLILYGVWLWRGDRRAAPLVAAALAAVAGFWFGLDWLGSGDALTGPGTAHGPSAHASATGALDSALGSLAPPIWILVAVALVAELRRVEPPSIRGWRRNPALMLAAVATAWLSGIVILGALGYIGSDRFVVGPACLLAPVIGVGVARALEPFAGRSRTLAAVALAALAVPVVVHEADRTERRFDELPTAESDALAELVAQASVGDALLACPGPVRIDDPRLLARLVYEVDAPASRAGTLISVARPPDSEGPQTIVARHGGPAEHELSGSLTIGFDAIVPLAANERWSAYEIACARSPSRH